MKRKFVSGGVNSLKPGEKLADQVLSNKKLIVEKDTILTSGNIRDIQEAGVEKVTLYMTPERLLPYLEPDQIILKGLQYGVSSYPELAETYFGAAIRKSPRDVSAHFYRGVSLYFGKKADMAINRFKTVLALINSINENSADDKFDMDRLKKRADAYIRQIHAELYGETLLNRFKKVLGFYAIIPITYTDNDDLITKVDLDDSGL